MAQQHDGPLGAGEKGRFAPIYLGDVPGGSEVRNHHCEWLLHPVFAVAQLLDRRRCGGVAGQVKTAQAFDGHDAAGRQRLLGCGEGGVPGRCIGAARPEASSNQTCGPQTGQATGWA